MGTPMYGPPHMLNTRQQRRQTQSRTSTGSSHSNYPIRHQNAMCRAQMIGCRKQGNQVDRGSGVLWWILEKKCNLQNWSKPEIPQFLLMQPLDPKSGMSWSENGSNTMIHRWSIPRSPKSLGPRAGRLCTAAVEAAQCRAKGSRSFRKRADQGGIDHSPMKNVENPHSSSRSAGIGPFIP